MTIGAFLISVLIFLWIVIYPLADLYGRRWSPRVIRQGIDRGRVALTFDDGPDPRYTPRVLEILKSYNAHATFFLVGRRAAAHPEIVRQIIRDGHEVAAHSETHRHAYTLLFHTDREISKSLQTLEQITGTIPRWYRPPWGAFNLFSLQVLKRNGASPVLWSVNADDWLRSTGAEGILQRLNQRMHPGAVIVLHDAGGDEDAPENTIVALNDWLKDLKSSGLSAVTLGELMNSTKGA